MEELSTIKWDDAGFSEVRRLGEEQRVLKSGHACYWKVSLRASTRKHEVGFLLYRILEMGNAAEFFSVNERVVSVTPCTEQRIAGYFYLIFYYAPELLLQ